jgi:DNA invertase Pin-like site-specific DNA recombinase
MNRTYTEDDVVLVYGRESRDPKDQRISVDRQLKKGCEYAARQWPGAIVLSFRDDDITGSKPEVVRPGFEKMLHELRRRPKGTVVGVWANEQSRLTRAGETGWDDLRVVLNMAGLNEVHTGIQGIIGIEPGNSLAGRLYAVIDSEFAERTKVKVQDAHADLFTEGRPSGRPPFGYRLKNKASEKDRSEWEEDPVQGPVVRKVFTMALDGHAMSAIADWLNAERIPPPSAGWEFKDGRQLTAWTATSVRSLLRSPSVAGLRGHTDAAGDLHTTPAMWEELIDVDQWRQVQRVLGQPTLVTGTKGGTYRVRTQPKEQPRRHLLSGGRRRSGIKGEPGEVYGVLRCGKCGYPLVAQTQQRRDGGRVGAYQCHPTKTDPAACGGVSISPADEVDRLVVDAIQRSLADSPKLRQRLDVAQDAEAARWRAERKEAQARMLEAAEMFGARAIDKDTFGVMHAPAKRDFELAEARLKAMTSDLMLPTAEEVRGSWKNLTLKQQRAVVERLIGRIVVAPGSAGRAGFNAHRVGTPEWLA